MATQVSSVAALARELNWHGKNGQYDKALKAANKILQENPNLEEVWLSKVVCLIHKGRFEDALQFIRKNFTHTDVTFEKAYCEYRLNRCQDALKTLSQAPNPDDLRIKELLGQIHYRVEDFAKSYAIYRELIKNTQDDFEDEREANLSASLAAIHLWTDQTDVDELDLRDTTYEMLYNSACILIAQRRFKAALDMLQRAEHVCKESLDEDEVEAELAFIRVQTGYVLQVIGKSEEALKLYNQVIKLKSSDPLVLAVACNNIVTINKDQSMFDSKKKIKTATSSDLVHKLSSRQKQAIALNECLLLLYSGQGDQCMKSVTAVQATCEKACLVAACKLLKDKQAPQAVLFLKECIKKRAASSSSSSLLQYAVVQLLLEQDRVAEAVEELKLLGDDSYSPGVVSTMVGLLERQGDEEGASDVINQAVQWHLNKKTGSEDVSVLMRAGAKIQLNAGKPQRAAQMLEELRKLNPGDLRLLAQLIVAYSRFDAKKAHQVSKQFPAAEEVLSSVDVASLETANHFVSKWTRKANKQTSPHHKSDVVVKKKPKKKKKKLLPKNYDPSVPADPERWLPLKERSTYRGKRRNRRKEIGKGTQGATSSAFPELNASESPLNSDIGSPKVEAAQAPRLQRPAGAPNKAKSKKKKGNKW